MINLVAISYGDGIKMRLFSGSFANYIRGDWSNVYQQT